MDAINADTEMRLIGTRRRKPSLSTYSVMGVNNDPYRLETAANIAAAQWFAEQVARFLPYGTIHLRGLYYRIVAVGDVLKPDGATFVNDDECWTWYAEHASSAGRWLGYVPFERIVDERNAAPECYTPDTDAEAPGVSIAYGRQCFLPSLHELLPSLVPDGFTARQPYRIIFVGEKTSLGSILRPIAQQVHGELLLPSGEMSDTMVYDAAKRATADGRPAVVLYFSDFDPSGHTMPVSVARKLQASKTLYFPDLDVRVYPVGLTSDQVKQFDLPSTPLKETERRADKWREAMGHEQTEIDAMIALHPEELRQIAWAAVRPFYDDSLAERVAQAKAEWLAEAGSLVADDPQWRFCRDEVQTLRDRAAVVLRSLETAQRHVVETLRDIDTPDVYVPEAEITAEAPEPIYSSRMDFVTASLRLKAHKAFEEPE
ncbi:MAG TPA: hypothetical protein VMU81_22910 [Acetobacteraceae bacterium]|nr:hypothetical protein [Acetobacteraceae bacterium]